MTEPPPPLLDVSRHRCHVSIVTGSYGRGHDAVAHELALGLRDTGCMVTIHDIASLLPLHAGSMLRSAYYARCFTHRGLGTQRCVACRGPASSWPPIHSAPRPSSTLAAVVGWPSRQSPT